MAFLSVEHISKTFPGVRALDDVSVDFEKGSTHALMGENGAGKSTLGKIIAGVYTADKGVIKLEGQEVKPTDPRIAQELGLAIVHQELAFCLNMTVAENLMLGTMRPTPDSLTGPNCGTGRKRCSTRLDPISTRIPLWRDALQLCSRAKGRGR
jgi:ABC-type sugar transport system ATPase subunit